jgi:modulator of FtsH protease HflC
MQKLTLPIAVILILGYFSIFKVEQWEEAIVFQFREVERVDVGPGLHFMIPFVNSVQQFEMRLLNLDQEPQRFLTIEKKDLIVDYYVKWRIVNTTAFYTATRGDMQQANALIMRRINGALREEFGRRTVQEVVAGERGVVMDLIRDRLTGLPAELGLEVVDVRTMRIDLPDAVSVSVFERMKAERNRVARDFRARGEEASERIKANADREREVILANAFREAEILRGEGDAEAANIYALAYNRNAEFYDFYRSLSAYMQGFSDDNSILLLQPDSDFFKYFRDPEGRR